MPSVTQKIPATIRRQMRFTDWLSLLLLSALWGGSFFFIEIGLTQLSPLTLVAMRVGLGALFLWGVVIFTQVEIPKKKAVWCVLIVLGALNNALPFTLIAWGQTQITSGLASILNATTPLFAIIVANAFLPDERASVAKVIGVLMGFSGVAIMFGSSAVSGSSPLLSQMAVLGGAFSYALGGVYGRRLKLLDVNPLVSAAGQAGAAFLLLLPLVFYWEGMPDFRQINTSVWLAMLGLAAFSTALAYLLYFRLLENVGATNVLLVTLLIPVSAITLGIWILGESLQWEQLLGMLCIAVGLLVIDGRLLRYCNQYFLLRWK